MKLRFLFSTLSVLLVIGLIHWYLGWNGWEYLRIVFGLENPAVYSIVIALLALSYILGRLGQSVAGLRSVAKPVKLVGSYWFAVMEYGLLLFPIADLLVWLLTLASVPYSQAVTLVGTVTLVTLAAILIRGSWNAWTPIVRSYNVTISKAAGSYKSLRIGMASDIHLGTIVGNRHLEKLVAEMERMKPDLILIPGDVIDDDIDPFIRYGMANVMKKLKAPLGVYAVLGNHEYYGGHIDRFVAEMKAIDIPVLMDETVLVDNSFYVIGRKDLTAARSDADGRQSIAELIAPLDTSLPLILMDHQPSDLEQAAANGIDISLSGHTHRGQMAPNHLVTRRMFELDWGYLRKGGLHAIVSSGFGSWGPPIRIGSRSEVIQIDVRFE
ncbi:metallophosphoesterase [Paenibacillus sp. NPDC058071]|uniref:metallophosphoesterase n=1 Tax=Paenibacillus sp. NPDC058071 TaxID=3346326 RepID=UPI0036D7B9F3